MTKTIEDTPDLIFDYDPNIFDINRYYDNFVHKSKLRKIIGNEAIRTTIPLVFGLRKVPVVVKGASGSAKSTIIKCAGQMVWSDEVFRDKVPEVLYMAGASQKGWLTPNMADRIKHRCTHCVAPELQNVIMNNDVAEAMIKLWTEGECYTYTRAMHGGRTAMNITLDPLPILTSIATENKYTDKLGEEMERRFFPMYTIASNETNERVHMAKAEAWSKPDEDLMTMSEEDKTNLRLHLQHCASEIDPRVKNPCAPFMRRVVPHTFVISNSMIELFFETSAAVTTFFHPDRIHVNGKTQSLLATPSDNWYAWFLAGEALVLASLNIPDLGKEIIDILPIRNEDAPDDSLNTNEIVDALSGKGYDRTKRQVQQIMKSLESVNYAKRESDTKDSYYRSRSYTIDTHVKWDECLEATKKIVKESYPKEADDYIAKYCEDPVVIHPFTGKDVKILDIEFRPKDSQETLDIAALIKEGG